MIQGYMNTSQASQYAGLSASHIRRLLEAGTLRGVKTGHDWLVEVASLDYYMTHRPKRGIKGKRSRSTENKESAGNERYDQEKG
jgi:excisionase family DNA binding protein